MTDEIRALPESQGSAYKKIYSDIVGAGTYKGVLDEKAWGRNQLLLFFTLESQAKVTISCFRSRKDSSIYGPRDDSVNFSMPESKNQKFMLDITVSKGGYLNLSHAEEMN